MNNKEQESEKLQWHPAFYAGLQIELQEDSDNLIFENEHQLGTKPKQIDALIIKKQKDIPVKKNIGKIFRGHNIVEYKSPSDYLCIDDYYKGYAYAMFYKSDTKKVDEIPIHDITLTFVSVEYPQKFIRHLETEWNYRLEEKYSGIYYIQKESDILPIQLIVTSKLNWEDNLWLRSLTNKLEDRSQIQKIVNEYHDNKSNKLYESVMDIIVRANQKEFEEAKGDMCKALEELMADVIEERVAEKVEEQVVKKVEEQVAKKVEEQVAKKVEEQVAIKVEEKVEEGICKFIELCQEFGISKEETLNRVVNKFLVTTEIADKNIKKYWK